MSIRIEEFQETIHEELIVTVSNWKVHRAKKEASLILKGKYKDQYKLLWNY